MQRMAIRGSCLRIFIGISATAALATTQVSRAAEHGLHCHIEMQSHGCDMLSKGVGATPEGHSEPAGLVWSSRPPSEAVSSPPRLSHVSSDEGKGTKLSTVQSSNDANVSDVVAAQVANVSGSSTSLETQVVQCSAAEGPCSSFLEEPDAGMHVQEGTPADSRGVLRDPSPLHKSARLSLAYGESQRRRERAASQSRNTPAAPRSEHVVIRLGPLSSSGVASTCDGVEVVNDMQLPATNGTSRKCHVFTLKKFCIAIITVFFIGAVIMVAAPYPISFDAGYPFFVAAIGTVLIYAVATYDK